MRPIFYIYGKWHLGAKDTTLLSIISKILTGSLVLVLIWLPLFLFYLSFTCPNLPDQATGHIFYIQELTHNAIYTHAMYATHTEFLLYSASFIAFAVVFSMFIVVALIAKRGTART
jgi:hypothetical protein